MTDTAHVPADNLDEYADGFRSAASALASGLRASGAELPSDLRRVVQIAQGAPIDAEGLRSALWSISTGFAEGSPIDVMLAAGRAYLAAATGSTAPPDKPEPTDSDVGRVRDALGAKLRADARDYLDAHQADELERIAAATAECGDLPAMFAAIEDDDAYGLARVLLDLNVTPDATVPGSLVLATIVTTAWAYVHATAMFDDVVAQLIELRPSLADDDGPVADDADEGLPMVEDDEPCPPGPHQHRDGTASDGNGGDLAELLGAMFAGSAAAKDEDDKVAAARVLFDAARDGIAAVLNLPEGEHEWSISHTVANAAPRTFTATGKLTLLPAVSDTEGERAVVTDDTGLVAYAQDVVSVIRRDVAGQ